MKEILFAVPPRRMTQALARSIAGSLGKPAKMPGSTWGISATACKVGGKLAKVEGSVCFDCYALKGCYRYSTVKNAHAQRAAGLNSVSFADAMIAQIKRKREKYFRWHDSGDLQHLQHLLDIVRVAEALPDFQFWLPTREKGIVLEYLRAFGDFPPNLCVRVSAAMVDGAPPEGFPNTSTVHSDKVQGFKCKAPAQDGKCRDCRACWDRSVKNVSYKKH
jgi:hypothetical protein